MCAQRFPLGEEQPKLEPCHNSPVVPIPSACCMTPMTTCLYRPQARKEVDRLSLPTFPRVQQGSGGQWQESGGGPGIPRPAWLEGNCHV